MGFSFEGGGSNVKGNMTYGRRWAYQEEYLEGIKGGSVIFCILLTLITFITLITMIVSIWINPIEIILIWFSGFGLNFIICFFLKKDLENALKTDSGRVIIIESEDKKLNFIFLAFGISYGILIIFDPYFWNAFDIITIVFFILSCKLYNRSFRKKIVKKLVTYEKK